MYILKYLKVYDKEHAMRLILTLKMLGYRLTNEIRDGIVYNEDNTVWANLEDIEYLTVEIESKIIAGFFFKNKPGITNINPPRLGITIREFIKELGE